MSKFIIFMSSVLLNVYVSEQVDFLSQNYINKINKVAETWKANQFFHPDTSIDSIKQLLEVKSFSNPVNSVIKKNDHVYAMKKEIPKSFDARIQWKDCKIIRNIPNQGHCGSGWAISVAGAFADRLCIGTNGKFNKLISAQELMTCCRTCGGSERKGACDAGIPIAAWEYLYKFGGVTGGNYNTTDGCQPYKIPPCYMNARGNFECPKRPTLSDLKCTKVCYGNKTIKYESDHYNTTNAYYVPGKNIQQELLAYGPLEASFNVYSDFHSYSFGIYKKSFFSRKLGKHSAKLIGWGEERGVLYWRLINSWGEKWGENGTFRIRRGTNECDIEKQITAGIPKV